MKRYFLFLATIIVGALAGSACKTGLFGGGDQSQSSPIVVNGVRVSYADVVERTSPAVVRIDAERRTAPQQFPFGDDDFFRQFIPQQREQGPQLERGMGSGVIVSADGTILTNHHVIDGAEKITVSLQNNKTYDAKVVGSDKPSDLAVLKIDASELPFLQLGDSDAVRVGDIVLAIGNPLGIGQTVTAGIISAKGRSTGISDGTFEDFLQTDAPINRGNSGGALVNLSGELIGINSQILSPSGGNIGIGFSIPSNMAKGVMEQLLSSGKVRRGMLGINIQDISEDVASSLELKDVSGVLVSGVRDGSAAARAGIKRGDVIVSLNGEKVDSGNVLRNKVAATAPGTELTVGIWRDGKVIEVKVRLDEFDLAGNAPMQNGGSGAEGGKLGLTLRPLTPETAKRSGAPAGTKGLLVTEVEPDGAAAESGITPGTIILEINKKQVTDLESVQDAIGASGGRPVLLLVMSAGRTAYVTVRPR